MSWFSGGVPRSRSEGSSLLVGIQGFGVVGGWQSRKLASLWFEEW